MRSSLETCTDLKMMSQDPVLYVSLSTLQLMPFTLTEFCWTSQCPEHIYKITGLKKREKGIISKGIVSAHISTIYWWVCGCYSMILRLIFLLNVTKHLGNEK